MDDAAYVKLWPRFDEYVLWLHQNAALLLPGYVNARLPNQNAVLKPSFHAQEPVSLETPIGEEEDSHLGDFIEDHDAPAPADAASFTLLREQLEEVF